MPTKRRDKPVTRIHLTIPSDAYVLFADYAATKQISMSAMLTDAGLIMIRDQRGDWARRVTEIESPGDEVITRAEFQSMTRLEKAKLWEEWR